MVEGDTQATNSVKSKEHCRPELQMLLTFWPPVYKSVVGDISKKVDEGLANGLILRTETPTLFSVEVYTLKYSV